ncbi:HTH-type transcriptional regulator CymR [Caprobacter fermentans]|uniref:HTH-type transcriptional regulator CymR n=1 Tax=Caproicibacter fermentans TaxID=2576756 RepID=A0A6N8HWL3_9FIRM|nr:Rrf2 family transcriptional regulator [Caproicibacter fermentans]MVB09783.1 HTH-type transcriptional regulator CymR [Caproicibacter fermentans]OCN03185.1 Rrf2 family transcriptional regulator [Clostridium sp. W14A]QNK42336.1 Rrf2 family transcriptional regulator [Caproicibacter fermentans]
MRISSKGRYGLAAMVCMAEGYGSDACITIISLSERLGISKIYLEQVFSLLKRGGLVLAIKGAQGGYKLSRPPQEIPVYEILLALEQSLFEKTAESVTQKAENIEKAMQASVFSVLDSAVEKAIGKITLLDLQTEAERQKQDSSYMFYI